MQNTNAVGINEILILETKGLIISKQHTRKSFMRLLECSS